MVEQATEIVRLVPGETANVWTTGEVTVAGLSRTIHSQVNVTLLEIEEGQIQLGISHEMTMREAGDAS